MSKTKSNQITMPIDDIIIGVRHRRDMGDIAGLAANISDLGNLLHPPVVRPDGTLVVGERRLEACKLLGWTEIQVRIVDIDAIVLGELAENAYRKDFTPSEMVAIAATVEERERELAKERQGSRTDKHPGKFPEGSLGQTRDKVAKPFGRSGKTLEKAQAVVAAAEAEPDKYGHLVEQMDRTGKVDGAYHRLKYLKAQEQFHKSTTTALTQSTPDIICGNCLEFLPTIPEPYFLISDPPYNQGHHYDGYGDALDTDEYRNLLLRTFQGKQAVIILYPEETIGLLSALGTPQEVVSWVYPSNTRKQHRLITWWNCKPDFSRLGQEYRNPTDKRVAELIDIGQQARLYDWWHIDQVKNVSKGAFAHPCPIPEEVARRIILLTTDVGNLVVDPFCCSGTIPYVAKVHGRRSIGIDISPDYCEIARRRLFDAGEEEAA
jgi:DNA modification methylase